MKKFSRLLAVLCIATLASAAAATARPSSPSGSAAASALNCKSTLKMAFLTPLTGDAGFLGTEQMSWAKYAVKTLQKRYGLKIQLLAGDTQLDASLASSLAQKYVADPKVVAILGPSTSGAVAATSQTFFSAGLAHI
jgi:branched-chain amino acid transport system substrate-binding protein